MARWDGMLPPHNCKRCGKPLNADGFHPAELYMGTYTGLCYACEKAPMYIESTAPDGGQRLSYPPTSPSHRRERETYIAYPDCPDCEGKGRFYISRSLAQGRGYYRFCRTCTDRWSGHPFRKRIQRLLEMLYMTAQRMYEKAVSEAGLNEESSREEFAEIGEPLLAKLRKCQEKVIMRRERWESQ